MKLPVRCTSEPDDIHDYGFQIVIVRVCLPGPAKNRSLSTGSVHCVLNYCLVIGLFSNRLQGAGEKVSVYIPRYIYRAPSLILH